MRKLINIFLILALTICSVEPVLAANVEIETNETTSYFSEVEAADIALLFVYNNIGTEGNDWSMDTIIDEVYSLYDFDDNITGYTFKLSTKEKYSGYITVSVNQNEMPIQEFSFTDMPIFEENLSEDILKNTDKRTFKEKSKIDSDSKKEHKKNKIVFNGPLEYYVNKEDCYYDLENKSVTRSSLKKQQKTDKQVQISNKVLKNIITESHMGKEYDGQLEGYAISNHITYMADRYTDYEYERGYELIGFVGLDMSKFGGDNDCTLVSITAVANWYRSTYPNIPDSTSEIYNDVLEIGKKHGYTTSGGTDPTKIDNIVEDVFKKWGYTIDASNTYAWSFNTFVEQINQPNYNPLLFNIATGYYASHTVTVIGYRDYNVADFLLVKDNWSTSTRYIHYQQMWNELGSVTIIKG